MELGTIALSMERLLATGKELWARLLIRVLSFSKNCWKRLMHCIVLILLVNLNWLFSFAVSMIIAIEWVSGALKTHRHTGSRQVWHSRIGKSISFILVSLPSDILSIVVTIKTANSFRHN